MASASCCSAMAQSLSCQSQKITNVNYFPPRNIACRSRVNLHEIGTTTGKNQGSAMVINSRFVNSVVHFRTSSQLAPSEGAVNIKSTDTRNRYCEKSDIKMSPPPLLSSVARSNYRACLISKCHQTFRHICQPTKYPQLLRVCSFQSSIVHTVLRVPTIKYCEKL